MGAELLFESRTTRHVLRQHGGTEEAPVIALELALTDAPTIYASGGAIINRAAWSMIIRETRPDAGGAPVAPAAMHYAATGDGPRCVIDVPQSPERFAALLTMFRGGHASEITVIVAHLLDKADYSKDWNTALHASLPIASLCFEFPLPQNEA